MGKQAVRVPLGRKVRLGDFDPGYTGGVKNKAERAKGIGRKHRRPGRPGLSALCRRPPLALVGAARHGHLGQGRHDPPRHGRVQSAKLPDRFLQGTRAEELSHDFLWRISRAAPRRGFVGIFNRSHYEDVLVVRVHNLVPRSEWQMRYERINTFERLLVEGGTTIVKLFLHISKKEQKKRLQSRLDDPDKRWKLCSSDVKERSYWNQYQRAYEKALASATPNMPLGISSRPTTSGIAI